MDNTFLIKEILKKHFNTDISTLDNYSTGYAGYVYGTTIHINGENIEVIVKLTPVEAEMPIEEESLNQRIYGTRYSNLLPAYNVLKQHAINLPEIFAKGKIHGNHEHHYVVMSKLKGESIREYLAYADIVEGEKLHTLVGKQFALVHSITRSYDGWVGQTIPHKISWEEAFFTSLRINFTKGIQLDSWLKEQEKKISEYISHKKNIFTPATEFVLSDIDGFQGMANYTNKSWYFSGLIDIEDHHYTDQRFVLAGHELSLLYENRSLPDSFWKAYTTIKSIPDTYASTKHIFILYYLLSWISIPFEDEKIEEEEKQFILAKFHNLIDMILKS